ncbi:MAG: hypothetical protein LPK45_09020, partial [Bacteroidota bacterium]|nr:hypothetical protein [Bacteroidota bacterium]MDX5431225.1 hypothetical protein [Bacteroidota bacterium]MDX5469964.1 hypothetical protein [Bacteroidota bacterium]
MNRLVSISLFFLTLSAGAQVEPGTITIRKKEVSDIKKVMRERPLPNGYHCCCILEWKENHA